MPPPAKKRNRREASTRSTKGKKSSRNEYESDDEADEAPTYSRQAFFPRRRNEQYPQHLQVNLLQLDVSVMTFFPRVGALARTIDFYFL